ncbi:MAG: Ig-like domain-containing protein [Planctomycetota bacterium]
MTFRHRLAVAITMLLSCSAGWAQEVQTQYPRLYVVSFNPILDTQGGQRLHDFAGWHNPATEVFDYMQGMQHSSHDIVNERLAPYLEMNFWPVKTDGFQYTEEQYLTCLASWSGWHEPDGVDYATIFRDYDLARKVDRGQVDELAIYGAPYFGYWESTMAGYGGYWCNSGPQQKVACSRIFITMGWNYERIVSLHATGHRTESILTYTYDGWGTNSDRTIWDRFGWNIGQTTISQIYGVGSAHLPANGDDHYDYANPQYVESYAPAWMDDFPAFNGKNGQTAMVSRETWGAGPTNNYELEYFKWWYRHMPHVAGRNQHDGYDRLNNWWEYIFNFNAHAESGGDHVPGDPPPPAIPYGVSVTAISANAYDDWTPKINTAGRIVWAQFRTDIYRGKILAADVDGSNLVQLGPASLASEGPQINDLNQVVWQAFDGQDFEIWTANADGTGITQVTNNTVNDWHPDISNTGRIVWDRWDGEDYEIFSANVDGSDVLQITSNSHGGVGKPRDDCWPRINASDRVVWMGYDGSNFQICSADADGSGLVQISTNAYQNEFPQIGDGGKVVWHTWHSDANAEVYSASATGGNLQRLSSNSDRDWWPQVSASGDVVWMQRTGGDWDIVLNGAPITTNSTHDQYPVIADDGRVTWQGFDGDDWEIYVYENSLVYQVTDNDHDDRAPHVRAGEIVWHAESALGDPNDPDYKGPTTEIFVASTEDLLPPTIDGVTAIGNPNRVVVTFTEPLEQTTAETSANYAIDHGVNVSSATLEPDRITVTLITSTLQPDITYTLTVNNVKDLAGNPIDPNSTASFAHQQAERVTDGLLVLYDFNEGAGTDVTDVSGVGTPLDLTIADPGNITWTAGGLQIDAATVISSAASAAKIINACRVSNEITIEAWIIPADAFQGGPARIITLSPHANSRNFTLGQGLDDGTASDCYGVRLRTTATNDNGQPALNTPAGLADTVLQHVVYTRDNGGNARIYLNGGQVAATTVAGDLSNWALNYRLSLANEPNLGLPWFGEYKLAAVFERALEPGEVLQNFDAGTGDGPAWELGDMNCDGDVNAYDIDGFICALSPQCDYEGIYPDCDRMLADCNSDGVVNAYDIDGFITLVGGG